MSQSSNGKLEPDPVKVDLLETALTEALQYLYTTTGDPQAAERAILTYVSTPGVFGAGDVSEFVDAIKNKSFKGVLSSQLTKSRQTGILYLRRYMDVMSARMRGGRPLPSSLTNISLSPQITKATLVPTLFKQYLLVTVNNVSGFNVPPSRSGIQVADGDSISDSPAFIQKLLSSFIVNPAAAAAGGIKLTGRNLIVSPSLVRNTVAESVLTAQGAVKKTGAHPILNNHFYKRLNPIMPVQRKNGTYRSAELRLVTSGKTDPIFDTEMASTLLNMITSGGKVSISDPTDSNDSGVRLGKKDTVQQNAQDMIAWNYLSGGGQFARRFVKYVPYAYLRQVRFFDKLGKLNLSSDNALELFGIEKRDEITTDNYYRVSRPIKQMVQHFPGQLATRVNRDGLIKMLTKLTEIQRTSMSPVNNGVPVSNVYNSNSRALNANELYSFEPVDEMELPKKFIRTSEGMQEVWPEFLTYYDYKTRVSHLWQYNGKRYIKIFTLGSSGTNAEYDITTDLAIPQSPTYPIKEVFAYEGTQYYANAKPETPVVKIMFDDIVYDKSGALETDLKRVVEKIVAHERTEPAHAKLLEFMLSNWDVISSKKNPIKYNINTNSNKTRALYDSATNTINIETVATTGMSDIDQMITHELVHALTMNILNNPSLMAANPEIKKRVAEIVELKNLLKSLIESNVFQNHSDRDLAGLTKNAFHALTRPGVDPDRLSPADRLLYLVFYTFKKNSTDSTSAAFTREAVEFVAEVLTNPNLQRVLSKIDLGNPEVRKIADKGKAPSDTSITVPRTMLARFKALFLDLFSDIMKVLGVDPSKNTLLTRSYSAALDLVHIGIQEKYAKMEGWDDKKARIEARSNLREHLSKASPAPDKPSSKSDNITPPGSVIEPITKLPFQNRIPELKKLGIIKDVYKYGDRPMVIVNVAGTSIPFYRSSRGTSGKEKGKWFPFFGFGKGRSSDTDLGWIIKGTLEQIDTNYGSEALQHYSDIINSTLNWSHDLDLGAQNNFIDSEITFSSDERGFNKQVFGKEDLGIFREKSTRDADNWGDVLKLIEKIDKNFKEKQSVGKVYANARSEDAAKLAKLQRRKDLINQANKEYNALGIGGPNFKLIPGQVGKNEIKYGELWYKDILLGPVYPLKETLYSYQVSGADPVVITNKEDIDKSDIYYALNTPAAKKDIAFFVETRRLQKHLHKIYDNINVPDNVVRAAEDVLRINFPGYIGLASNPDALPLIANLANYYAKVLSPEFYNNKDSITEYIAHADNRAWSNADGVLYVEHPVAQVSFHVFNDQDLIANKFGQNSDGMKWSEVEVQFIAENLLETYIKLNNIKTDEYYDTVDEISEEFNRRRNMKSVRAEQYKGLNRFYANASPERINPKDVMPDLPDGVVDARIKQLQELGIEDVDAVLAEYARGVEHFRDDGPDAEAMIWDLAVSKQRVVENPEISENSIDIELDDETEFDAYAFADVVPLYKDLAVTLSLQSRELNKRIQQVSSELEMTDDEAEKIELNQLKLKLYDQLQSVKARRIKISGKVAPNFNAVIDEIIKPMLAEARIQIQSGDPGQLMAAKRTIEYVEMLGDFSKETHQLFSKAQLDLLRSRVKQTTDPNKTWLDVVRENVAKGNADYIGMAALAITNAAATATELRGMFDRRVKVSLTDMVKSSFAYLPPEFVITDIVKDIDILSKTFLSMDDYSSEVTQAAFDQIKKQLHKGDLQADILLADIDKMFSKLSPSEKRDMYELFRQTFSNTDNRNTGNMIHPFTAEFQDNLEKIVYVINNLGKDAESLRKYGGRDGLVFGKFRQLAQEAHMMPIHQYLAVDLYNDQTGHPEPGMVTSSENAEAADYYTQEDLRIKSTFTKKFGAKADDMLKMHKERAVDLGRRYLADKKAFIQSVENDLDLDAQSRNALIKRWMFENSPFVHAEIMRLKGVNNPNQLGPMKVSKTVTTMLQEMGFYDTGSGAVKNREKLEITSIGFNYSTFVPRETYKKVESIKITAVTDGVTHVTGKSYRETDEDVVNDYYDNNFAKVLHNDAMLEVWAKTLETLEILHKLMPYSMRNKLHGNSLPSISKTISERFEGNTTKGKVKELVDTLKRSVRDEDKFLQDYTARDVYGNPVDDIGVKYMTFNEQEIREYVTAKMIIENSKNPIDKNLPEEEQYRLEKARRENFRREKIHEISQRKTIDMETMLKAYALTANEYHQKVKIESLMQMAYYFLTNNARAAQLNSKGEQVVGAGGAPQTSDVRHLAEAFRNNLDAFYNYNLHKKQMVVSGKVLGMSVDEALLTDADKAERKLLQEAIDVLYTELKDQAGVTSPEDVNAIVANKTHPNYNIARKYITLTSSLKDSEQALIGSKIVDGANILTHFIGIGYNIISAFNNVTFALLAAGVRAAKGDVYTEEHYNKALRVMLDSFLNFWSFNKYKTPVALKIRAAMERYRVLKEQKNEIYSSSRKSKAFSFFDRFKNLSPYNLQARGEYFAQGSQFLALLMAHPATVNDETKTLYDFLQNDGSFPDNIVATASYYDKETGEKKFYEIQGKEAVEEHIKTLIDKVIKDDQGNYDRTAITGLKRDVLLRIFGTFKSWMWKSYNVRFGAEQYDYKLGMLKKGRYRSGIGGSLLSSTLLGIPLPVMVSWSKVTNSEGRDVSPLEQSIFATKMLLKKALWGIAGKMNSDWEYKDEAWEEFGFSYVDAMNLKANLQECLWHLTLSCMVLVLKYMVADEEDDGILKSTLIGMLNIAGRLTADIDFYVSASKTKKMINPRNVIPISTHIDDLMKWTEAFKDVMTGDSTFKTGPHTGENKLYVRTMQTIPFVRNLYRQLDLGKMVYDESMRADVADIRR